MDKLIIRGGKKLSGTVQVSGAKNSALPILFATVLTSEKCLVKNVPDLADIKTTVKILQEMGIEVSFDVQKHEVTVRAEKLSKLEASYELVRTMRASVLILGPVLARYGKARVSLPGGCSIGARPVNLHLSALEKMGAKIEIEGGYINAECAKLNGADIAFDQVSVGATENIMMAATLAKGRTVMRNCAQEPEIVDLANFLRSCGAKISGEGTSVITIDGVEKLHGCEHDVIHDRIEAGTYLIAAAITGGSVKLPGVNPKLLQALLDKLSDCGFNIVGVDDGANSSVALSCEGLKNGAFKSVDVSTTPFPGFPTDMQAQFMSLMCLGDGVSVISENIFENRFMHVAELQRLGADIKIQGNTAVVKSSKNLSGATVMATDLRASASLVLAALAAKGETTVRRIYHLDRGYERMEEKLSALGAEIRRDKE